MSWDQYFCGCEQDSEYRQKDFTCVISICLVPCKIKQNSCNRLNSGGVREGVPGVCRQRLARGWGVGDYCANGAELAVTQCASCMGANSSHHGLFFLLMKNMVF